VPSFDSLQDSEAFASKFEHIRNTIDSTNNTHFYNFEGAQDIQAVGKTFKIFEQICERNFERARKMSKTLERKPEHTRDHYTQDIG
jgi:hypothetical protein